MKKKTVCIILLILLVLLIVRGCNSFAIEEKIIDNYYLIATDVNENCDLSYHEPSDRFMYTTIVANTVFAVGYNDKYIIVKQHPRTFPNPPNKTITNYYILPLKNGMDWNTKNGLIGPLTLEQFSERQKVLNISEIKFTKEIKDLK